jgi:hypothetical protein
MNFCVCVFCVFIYLLIKIFIIMSEQTSIEKRTISGSIIDAMRANNWLRSDGYTLKDGFAGDYTIEEIKARKTRTSKEFNNFNVHAKGAGRKVILPGATLANARILSSDTITGKSIANAENVFFSEDIADALADSVIFNEAEDMDDSYVFPKAFKIVGAVVTKNEDTDKPTMPLRKYKSYNSVLRHHRKAVEDPDAFITKDLFKEYLASGEVAGVSETELTLLGTVKEDEMKHWNFTLLIADLARD